jgi:membrane-bound ClpP family serine protease
MDEALLLWGVGLFLLAFLLLILEFIIPSGGLIGLLSLATAIGGCVAFWRLGLWWGIASTISVIVAIPLALIFAFKVMPYTPLGRELFLHDPAELDDELAAKREREQAAERQAMHALIGTEGTVVLPCRPIGMALLEGQRVEVLSLSGQLEVGQAVRVVGIDGNTIKVRTA